MKSSEVSTILIILGATGDLMKKKIIPAIYNLYTNERLPHFFHVVGIARRNLTDNEFQDYIKYELKEKNADINQERLEKFSNFFSYLQGDFSNFTTFHQLKSKLEKIDLKWGICSNKLFYMAIPPIHYNIIFKNMVRAKLNIPCGGVLGWTRLLVEKPFGNNLKEAKQLFKLLNKYFKEEQLYLIDHYLAKNIVQAIMHFRFSNNLFEKSWNKNSIEKIEVKLLESVGVEERGTFYDKVGTFRDVGQSHLLQLVAAITMNSPGKIVATSVRQRRAEIMETLKKWDSNDIQKETFRAQYKGYKSVKNVSQDSTTETYFKLKTQLTHPSWKGVSIFLESGKRIKFAQKEIIVTFKHPSICAGCNIEMYNQNKVIFEIEPENKISIHFWTKKPGFEQELEERTFDFFIYKPTEKMQLVEEYAELIFNCLIGNQTMFVSEREIIAQWKFTDPVISGWQKNIVPLEKYQPDEEEIKLITAHIGTKPPIKNIVKEMAIIGLGKMGSNMALHLLDKNWRIVGFNRTSKKTSDLSKFGLIPTYSLKEMVEKLPDKKIIFLMLPAGNIIDNILFGPDGLINYLKINDVVIDGGNSFYKESIMRAKKLSKLGIHFLDCGISGGPSGARNGASLMIGGKYANFEELESLFRDIALPDAYQFFPGIGAGHFVKMVHNAIEYGMMQAIAEGFTILKNSKYQLDLKKISDVYNHGSVIESQLINYLEEAFEIYGENLKNISGKIDQSGEGQWAINTAKEMKLPVKIIQESLLFRIHSQTNPTYTGQIVSALRGQFGGHKVAVKK